MNTHPHQYHSSGVGRGGRRHLPYAFTEHGALMLGNVLKSVRAVEVSLMVVRAFVHLRELVSAHKELWIKQLAIRLGCKRPQPSRWLSQKLNQLERKVGAHDRAIAEFKEPLIKSIMNRVVDKNGMIARRATPVVVILRCQGAQHGEHPLLPQPEGHWFCGRSAASDSWQRE
jgi:hypothetical protein